MNHCMSLQNRVSPPFAPFVKGWGVALNVTALAIAIVLSASLHAQDATCGITQPPPADAKFYPPIAKAAHVNGQVILLARFDHDGKATVSQVLSGPEMLRSAARTYIESSKAGVSNGSRECPVIVTFELAAPTGCEMAPEPAHSFSQSDSQHVVISGQAMMLCDPAGTVTRKKHFIIF
jgi:hypothetical protein